MRAAHANRFGSLGAGIVLQIWLLLSAYILLLGAALNAELERSGRGGAVAN